MGRRGGIDLRIIGSLEADRRSVARAKAWLRARADRAPGRYRIIDDPGTRKPRTETGSGAPRSLAC